MAKKPAKPSKSKTLPKSIIIAGHSFSVEEMLLEDKHGECDVAGRKIRINSESSLEMKWHTLFHEVLHAVLGIAGLSEILEEKVEEAVVLSLDHLLWPLVEFR